MTLTHRYRFSASHRLYNPALSEQENREIYGRCSNPYGHGHDYILEVSVEGSPDAVSGRMIASEDLDLLVHDGVLRVYKGKNMNLDIDTFVNGRVPTTENVAQDIRERLERGWPANGEPFGYTARMPTLSGVRLFETAKNIFDI
ncbi:MAG: 6-carboxytetrahydropterin synthase [Bryobacterales bacterium]|nr:6-carboxytetrahydropterin synthase [Bryobacterales bacterium]